MYSQIQSIIRFCKSLLPSDETQKAKAITYENIGGGNHTSYAFQEVGFASQIPQDSDLAIVSAGGNVDNSIIVGTNHQLSRPINMVEGEVRIYSWVNGALSLIQILPNQINITSPTVNITASIAVNITTPTVNINGNVAVTGSITTAGDVTIDGDSFLNHTHKTGSATSGPPIN